jgi:prepilin-type N-terminal cleavage/methylation domain-containing protein/prepilin-type processing-associated H-X9-DG protein
METFIQRRMVTPHPLRRGFSLIEMLVVILIIVILISILLPAISRARELARSAACAANLRSLGQVTLIYINQSQGILPYGTYGNPDFPVSSYNSYFGEWANLDFYLLVGPPVQETNNGVIGQQIPQDLADKWDAIFWCPDRQVQMVAQWGLNYAANPNVFLTPITNPITGKALNQSLNYSAIPDPAQVIEIGDTNQSFPGGNCASFLFSWLPSQLSWQYGSYTNTSVIPPNPGNTDATTVIINHQGLRYRHNSYTPTTGSANVEFCDGHVAAIAQNELHVLNVLPGN